MSIRALEKQLFNKPVKINNNLITINRLEYNGITPSGPIQFFYSNINGYCTLETLVKFQEEDIWIIFYDVYTGKKMKAKCNHNMSSLTCSPYYPIYEGTFVLKLEKPGFFTNGDTVLPFDLTNNMYNITVIYNETTKLYEEFIDDRRIKIYNLSFHIPLYYEFYYTSGGYGKFFYYFSYISFYNKNIVPKTSFNMRVNYIPMTYPYGKNGTNLYYNMNCNFIKLKKTKIKYNDRTGGDYLLKCEGSFESNLIREEEYINLVLKIGDSSLGILGMNYIIHSYNLTNSPNNILEVNSIKYQGISIEGKHSFKLFGKSRYNKIINYIGSKNELYDFNIYFYGGKYLIDSSSCFLNGNGNNSDNFIIECYLNNQYLQYNYSLFSVARMEKAFMNGNAKNYELILPFDLYFDPIIETKKNKIDKALEFLEKNAEPHSTKQCGRYVGKALNAGGFNIRSFNRDAYLFYYDKLLVNAGFKIIEELNNKSVQDLNDYYSEQQRGVILVILNNTNHTYGHICMYNGTKWISDFVQDSMVPYTQDPKELLHCFFFRYDEISEKKTNKKNLSKFINFKLFIIILLLFLLI